MSGQDEIDIVRLADITIVVLVPGMGDDVQSIKAGIMEIADIFVLNKSDREGADRLEQEVRAMQSLASRHTDWIPPIVRTVANAGDGLVELAVEMNKFRQWLDKDGRWEGSPPILLERSSAGDDSIPVNAGAGQPRLQREQSLGDCSPRSGRN